MSGGGLGGRWGGSRGAGEGSEGHRRKGMWRRDSEEEKGEEALEKDMRGERVVCCVKGVNQRHNDVTTRLTARL